MTIELLLLLMLLMLMLLKLEGGLRTAGFGFRLCGIEVGNFLRLFWITRSGLRQSFVSQKLQSQWYDMHCLYYLLSIQKNASTWQRVFSGRGLPKGQSYQTSQGGCPAARTLGFSCCDLSSGNDLVLIGLCSMQQLAGTCALLALAFHLIQSLVTGGNFLKVHDPDFQLVVTSVNFAWGWPLDCTTCFPKLGSPLRSVVLFKFQRPDSRRTRIFFEAAFVQPGAFPFSTSQCLFFGHSDGGIWRA